METDFFSKINKIHQQYCMQHGGHLIEIRDSNKQVSMLEYRYVQLAHFTVLKCTYWYSLFIYITNCALKSLKCEFNTTCTYVWSKYIYQVAYFLSSNLLMASYWMTPDIGLAWLIWPTKAPLCGRQTLSGPRTPSPTGNPLISLTITAETKIAYT